MSDETSNCQHALYWSKFTSASRGFHATARLSFSLFAWARGRKLQRRLSDQRFRAGSMHKDASSNPGGGGKKINKVMGSDEFVTIYTTSICCFSYVKSMRLLVASYVLIKLRYYEMKVTPCISVNRSLTTHYKPCVLYLFVSIRPACQTCFYSRHFRQIVKTASATLFLWSSDEQLAFIQLRMYLYRIRRVLNCSCFDTILCEEILRRVSWLVREFRSLMQVPNLSTRSECASRKLSGIW